MKKIALLISALFLFGGSISAQRNLETVYLKNGSIIKGEIIEQVPNQSLKVKTKDGSVFVYSINEVEKITKEEKDNQNVNRGHRGLDFNIDFGGDFNKASDFTAEIGLGKRFNYMFYGGLTTGVMIGGSDPLIPILADFKAYFPLNHFFATNSRVAPFFNVKSGYVINTADDVTVGSGKNKITVEMPNYVMFQLLPGIQIPISEKVDFNLAMGFSYSVPVGVEGAQGGGAFTMKAGFGFHKGLTKRAPIPIRDNGFQLTLEVDAISPWNAGNGASSLGPNVILGYKLNPNLSLGLGFSYSVMGWSSYAASETFYAKADGKGKKISLSEGVTPWKEYNKEDRDLYDDQYDESDVFKMFLRGQYRLNNKRFSPIAAVDVGFRKSFTDFSWERESSLRARGFDSEKSEKSGGSGLDLLINPCIGFSLRTTSNSYFEMKLGYTIASGFGRYDIIYNQDNKSSFSQFVPAGTAESVKYSIKTNTSGLYLSLGWSHTFGSRKK